MTTRYLFVKTILMVSLTLVCIQQSGLAEQSENKTSTGSKETMAYHQQIIELNKRNESVIAEKLDIHPVTAVYNREAIIPAMCYTKTKGQHNPCYVCHQNPQQDRENKMADGALQIAYSFSDVGLQNHWKNLFEDRNERIDAISDQEIMQWVNQDNYSELSTRLENASFKGWIPDLKDLQKGADAFDQNGFAKDGSLWVAFSYKPFPSTFWPTNGSTDDVMIRLDKPYRTNQQGKYVKDLYIANLSITEANMKGLKSISTLPIDENVIGVDLNNDGDLSVISEINKVDQYVGAAETHFLQQGTYPQKTEFLHTVRYLGFNEKGEVTVSKRMKEVRYLKKWAAHPLVALTEYYLEESYEKEAGNLPGYTNLKDHGLDNGMGWSVSGFIEDAQGRLRTYTFEENLACMGCHNSIGATIDKTFSFPRKIDGAKGWGYINLKGMPDAPNRSEQQGEILTYFKRVGGGGEFRSNLEMFKRWFNKDGTVNDKAVLAAEDVYALITPSKQRAIKLNKAYRTIVEDQDYIFGKEVFLTPPLNVYEQIKNETSPTLPEEKYFVWDLRLDWSAKEKFEKADQAIEVSQK